MNKKFVQSVFKVLAGVIFSGLCAWGGSVEAGSLRQYSADMVSYIPGREPIEAKIYVSGDKVRQELGQEIMIIRLDKGLFWVIVPDAGFYIEQPLDQQMILQFSQGPEEELERTSLGQEAVDGKPAEKFKISYQSELGRVDSYQWVRSGSEIPVKLEAADGSWSVEYRNISEEPQPEALFELPSGFQKMSIPDISDFGQ